jgi:hypothetical protein
MSALHVAAANGFVKTCEVIMDYSDDVEIDALTKYEQSCLHLACGKGHFTMI